MKVKAIALLLVTSLGSALAAPNIVSMPQQREGIIDKLDAVLTAEPVIWPDEHVARLSPFSPVEVVVVAKTS